MLRDLLIATLTVVAGALPIETAPAIEATPQINCNAYNRNVDLQPLDPGPLTLAAVYCQSIKSSWYFATVSSDGSALAFREEFGSVVKAAKLEDADNWTSYDSDLGTFSKFGTEPRSLPAFVWDSDSQFIWTANQERMRPSGFALTGMQPGRHPQGATQQLPSLSHPAGPLDALLWVGGDGLAVAQFGTRGGFYRPPHDDPSPIFAIVDAKRGMVLDSLPFDALEPQREGLLKSSPYVLVRYAAATLLPDGRVRVLFELSVGRWVVWTQGEAPRSLPNPYAGERWHRLTLSPDGSSVLVTRKLQPLTMCGRTGGCKVVGPPVEGAIAALHNLNNAAPLWTMGATVEAGEELPGPAISPDGKYALLGLYRKDGRLPIALISMTDGKIIQIIPSPGDRFAMGFARAGKTAWTHAYGLTALYDFRPGTE